VEAEANHGARLPQELSRPAHNTTWARANPQFLLRSSVEAICAEGLDHTRWPKCGWLVCGRGGFVGAEGSVHQKQRRWFADFVGRARKILLRKSEAPAFPRQEFIDGRSIHAA